jgi:hypothetical protein
MRPERAENTVQIVILLVIGGMAGAASFTHVHDWTMHNVPAGTGGWFGWANAVISNSPPLRLGWRSAAAGEHTEASPTP